MGIFVCDNQAWAFTPTALYIQKEVQSDETPNAVKLDESMAQNIAIRTSETERSKVNVTDIDTPKEIELGNFILPQDKLEDTSKWLEQVPPVPFDIARQVRVFEPYIQFVEIRLRGAELKRPRIRIPYSVLNLISQVEIDYRLQTIFELFPRGTDLTQFLENLLSSEIERIRYIYTRYIGQLWGRVILRSQRNEFDKEIEELRNNMIYLVKSKRLEEYVQESIKRVYDYYLPIVLSAHDKSLFQSKPEQAKEWLWFELERLFPKPEDLIGETKLDVIFRDVTYETLHDPEFVKKLKKAYPEVDWDKPFKEFTAAKEKDSKGN